MRPMDASTDQILTIYEVGEWLRIAPATVRLWAANGKLPGWKIGKDWRFRRSAITASIERMEQQNKPICFTNVQTPRLGKLNSPSEVSRLDNLRALLTVRRRKRSNKS